MSAWFAGRTAIMMLCGAALALPAHAEPVADRLADLKQALQAVRATKASNPERDAGPELNPVKVALRRWVEAQLPTPSMPGRIEGTIETPTAASLSALARQLNDELNNAQLTCGDFNAKSYRCGNPNDPDDIYATERGHVGVVQLGLLDYGTYLLVVTGVGVLCGQDQSAYLYEADKGAWKLVFSSEQNDYRKGVYAVQNFTEIAVSPWVDGKPETHPLVATLGYGPWCSSTWSSLFTRLWRISTRTTSPKPLIDRTDGMWWGNEDYGAASLEPQDLLVQYTDASMDAGVHSRKHVRRYHVSPDDRIQRIDPVALRPMDFVDEWLKSDWTEASSWIDGSRSSVAFVHAHKQGPAEYEDTGKRCRSDPSLWQVVLAGRRYFQVRWSAPYVFRLVAVSRRPFAGCNIADPAADEDVTLFPETQWNPAD